MADDDDGYTRKNDVLMVCTCRDRLLRTGEKCPGAFDDCPSGPCEHQWDGPERIFDPATEGYGATATCSRCGMDAVAHDMWVAP